MTPLNPRKASVAAISLGLFSIFSIFEAFNIYPLRDAAAAPLRVLASNPRYFTVGSGKAIYLTGSHERNNLQATVNERSLSAFDYDRYLDTLEKNNHNFIRLWTWEDSDRDPLIYERTGPGTALDGGPKFDLSRSNPAYFEGLRRRVIAARDRGIYVSVMLFQGWSVGAKSDAYNKWSRHPFNMSNNIQAVNGDPNGDGNGYETHELKVPAITELQKAHIRKVIDTLNDLDNVLYEISELEFVWKSFTRGLQPIIIDGRLNGLDFPVNANARAAMGHTRTYADRMNLAAMTPRPDLSSTSYALANPGSEYIIYQPGSGDFTVNLQAGTYSYEWFNVDSGSIWQTGNVSARGGSQKFTPPFDGQAVLYLKSK